MTELKGMDYLTRKLMRKRPRVMMRYKFYDQQHRAAELSKLIPPSMRWVSAPLGWCTKAVDSIADRTVFDRFRNDYFLIDQIYGQNNADVLFDSAVISSLISSCCFIYIGKGADNYPTMQVIDGGNATGVIDPTTGMLTEGYAVLARDEFKTPSLEAYFTPGKTEYYIRGKRDDSLTLTTDAPYALLVPVIYRPDALRPFGHSRISRACMGIVDAAVRTLRRSEVSAEFYSVPQKYLLGLDPEVAEGFDPAGASIAAFLQLSKGEDGDKPTVGQFDQQSMAPYYDAMKMDAALFAGETGLTLDDLGFTTDNPASYDAIRASHEMLRLTARKAQRCFSVGIKNAGYLAACVRDGRAWDRADFRDLEVLWAPIFEPDAGALGAIGDAILKINQVQDGFMGADNIRAMTGLTSDAAQV